MSAPQYDQGLHIGQIVSHNLGKANTGTPQIVLRVKILGIPKVDGTYEAFKFQNERTIFISLTEKTVDFVIPQLEAMGFDGASIDQLDPENPKAVNLAGNQVDLWCKHEKDQKGELRERWNVSTPREAIVTEKLDAKEVRQLNTLFGKALKKGPPPKTAAKSVPAKQQSKSNEPPVEAYDDTQITNADLPDNMQDEEEQIPF